MPQDPRTLYSGRLSERRADIAARERQHSRLGYWRLVAAIIAVVLIVAALMSHAVSVIWAALPLAAFVALVVIHERLLRGLERRRRAEAFYERGLARLDGAWTGSGPAGESYLKASHLYAGDLDLFGKGSLFELLCRARTHIGEDTLARWLLEPASVTVALERQAAVEELRTRVDLREDLAIVAEEARTGVNPVSLAAWGEAPPVLPGGSARLGLWALTALGLAGLAAFLVFDAVQVGALQLTAAKAALLRDFFLVALVVNGTFLFRVRNRVRQAVESVDEAAHELKLLSETLVRLEGESFQSPILAALRDSLDAAGDPPSKRLARLSRLTERLDSRDHLLVRLLEPFALWSAHLAFAADEWRRISGGAVRRWLSAIGEMEALCSLAGYAFEHPADPFPEFAADGPWLEADGVAHPLIAESRAVRNTVRLGGELRLMVVSGSNMSGKSTLLRTLGVNVVLAQAGAPVRANRLRLSPLAVCASIQVMDSLQSGVSHFYAEVLRLRQIVDQTAGSLPVFFLIDEFLQGTNSHDRRIGAEALLRGLVERGAIGLATTHDLALAEIAEGISSRAANVHLEDRMEDGRIHFDYILRPGVVRNSNALELMRSVGLQV